LQQDYRIKSVDGNKTTTMPARHGGRLRNLVLEVAEQADQKNDRQWHAQQQQENRTHDELLSVRWRRLALQIRAETPAAGSR